MNRKPIAPDALPSRLIPGAEVGFVILHHTGVEEPHFDLMLDVGEGELPTWRICAEPGTWKTAPPAAVRLADHRRIYLTFEGAISGNRGSVKRIAQGAAIVRHVGEKTCVVELCEPLPATLTLPRA